MNNQKNRLQRRSLPKGKELPKIREAKGLLANLPMNVGLVAKQDIELLIVKEIRKKERKSAFFK